MVADLDLGGIDHRQVRAHVDIGAVRNRIVERQDGVGEGVDDLVLGRARMVAVEDRMHEGAVDRTAVLGAELRQLLRALGKRRAALSGPHHGVEGEPRHHVGVVLGKQRGAQRAGGNAVDQQWPLAAQALDIGRGRRSNPRPHRRSGRCCRGSWWSGRNPPCRPTRCRSRGGRRTPWRRSPAVRARRDRRSAARPSRNRGRTGSSPWPWRGRRRTCSTGKASRLPCWSSAPGRSGDAWRVVSFMNGPFPNAWRGGGCGLFRQDHARCQRD